MRILVLGGYGNFGARICRALAGVPGTPGPGLIDIEVIAAGRHAAPAAAHFAGLSIQAAELDVAASSFPEALRRLRPACVIHCVGPFQEQDYRVAHAALDAGAHYIDLADGRDFVARFASGVLAHALQVKRLAVTGASTLPALSSAVVDALASRFSRLHAIESVIAPAQRAPRGAATLAGVMSYAGRPFSIMTAGQWRTAYGWLDLRRLALGELGARLSALCDVPDLALFPARYPGVATVTFRAALEIGIQHRGIALLAALRRGGLQVPVERIAPQMESVARTLDRFGSELGGMEVRVGGTSHQGRPLKLVWRIIAPDNHGPEIPCMAAVLLARKLASGAINETGAQPCMGLLTLAEFETEFAKWGMRTIVEELA